jgi:hypothetical protein
MVPICRVLLATNTPHQHTALFHHPVTMEPFPENHGISSVSHVGVEWRHLHPPPYGRETQRWTASGHGLCLSDFILSVKKLVTDIDALFRSKFGVKVMRFFLNYIFSGFFSKTGSMLNRSPAVNMLEKRFRYNKKRQESVVMINRIFLRRLNKNSSIFSLFSGFSKPKFLSGYSLGSVLGVGIFFSVLLLGACSSPSDEETGSEVSEKTKPRVSTTENSGDIPGGRDVSSVDKVTGKAQLSLSLASLSTPSSPAFPISINYKSNTYLDTLATTKSLPASDVGLGWHIPALNSQIVRSNQGTGTFEDDTFRLFMGNNQYVLQYQCGYPCAAFHPNDYEATSVDGNNYRVKYYVTNQADFSVIKYIVNTKDTGETYGTWKVVTSSGMKYLFGGHSSTNPASLRTAETDISNRTVCKWLTNTSTYTVNGFAVPSGLNSGCEAGDVNLGVRWGNWIGANDFSTYTPVSGKVSATQQQYGSAWNLSQVVDARGLATNLYWAQNTQNVGLNGATSAGDALTDGIQSFSRGAYVYKIEAANGDRMVVNYCPRTLDTNVVKGSYTVSQLKVDRPYSYYACDTSMPVEGYDGHMESDEPDGFQEMIRLLYVKSIDTVLNAPANAANSTTYDYNPNNRVELDYNSLLMDGGAFSRRVLSKVDFYTTKKNDYRANPSVAGADSVDSASVSPTVTLSQAGPSQIYCYYGFTNQTNNCNGGGATALTMNGLLQSVTSVGGSTTTYSYKEVQLANKDVPISISGETGLINKTPVYGQGFTLIHGIRFSNSSFDIDLYQMTPKGWVKHLGLFKDLAIPPGDETYFVNQNIAMLPNGFLVKTPNNKLYWVKQTLGTTSGWEAPVQLASGFDVSAIGIGSGAVGVLGTAAEYMIYNTYDNWQTLNALTLDNGTTQDVLPDPSNKSTLAYVSSGTNYLGFWRTGTSSNVHTVTLDLFYHDEMGRWYGTSSDDAIHKVRTDNAVCTEAYGGGKKQCEKIDTSTDKNTLPEAPYISSMLSGSTLAINLPIEQKYYATTKNTNCGKTGCSWKTPSSKLTVVPYAYSLDIPLDFDFSTVSLQRTGPPKPSDYLEIKVNRGTGSYDDGTCRPNDVGTSVSLKPLYLYGYTGSAVVNNYGSYSGGYRKSHINYNEYMVNQGGSGCNANKTKKQYTTDHNDPDEDFSSCKFTTLSGGTEFLTESKSCQGSISPLSDTMLAVSAGGIFQYYALNPRTQQMFKMEGPDTSSAPEGTYTLVSNNSGLALAGEITSDVYSMGMTALMMMDPVGVAFLVGNQLISGAMQAMTPGYHYKTRWSQPDVASMASGGGWFYQGNVVYTSQNGGGLTSLSALWTEEQELQTKYFGALYGYIPFVVDDGTNHTVYLQNLANLDATSNGVQELWANNRIQITTVASDSEELYTVGQYNPVVETHEDNAKPVKYLSGRGAWDRYVNLAGPGAFLTYEYKASGAKSFYDQSQDGAFQVYRMWEEFDPDGYVDYVVNQVTVSDGLSATDNTVSYAYDLTKTGYSSLLQSGIYGNVSVYPGVAVDGSGAPSEDTYGHSVVQSYYASTTEEDPLLLGYGYQTDTYKAGESLPVTHNQNNYTVKQYSASVATPGGTFTVPLRTPQLIRTVASVDQVPTETDYTYTDYNLLKTTSQTTLAYKPLAPELTGMDTFITQVNYAWERSAYQNWVEARNSLTTQVKSQTTHQTTDYDIVDFQANADDISVIFEKLDQVQLNYQSNQFTDDKPDEWQHAFHGCFQDVAGVTPGINSLPTGTERCKIAPSRFWTLVKVSNDTTPFGTVNTATDGTYTLKYEFQSASMVYQLQAVDDPTQCLDMSGRSNADVSPFTISLCDKTNAAQQFQFLYGNLQVKGRSEPQKFGMLTMSNLKWDNTGSTTESLCWGPTAVKYSDLLGYGFNYCGVLYSNYYQDAEQFLIPGTIEVVNITPAATTLIVDDNSRAFEWCLNSANNNGVSSCQDASPATTDIDKYTMLAKVNKVHKTGMDSTTAVTLSTVTVRDPNLLVPLETQDALKVTSSLIYSSNDRLLPITSFANASVAGNEAGYMGFEAYEAVETVGKDKTWDIENSSSSAVISSNASHSGMYALGNGIAGQSVYLSHDVSPPADGSGWIVASVWVKPLGNAGKCSISHAGSNPMATSSSDASWQYLEIQVNVGGDTGVNVSCTTGGYIDSFRFSPLGSGFEALVYAARDINDNPMVNPYWQVQQGLDENGGLLQTYYDDWYRTYSSLYTPITGSKRLGSIGVSGLSRLSGFGQISNSDTSYMTPSFSEGTPNSVFSVLFRDATQGGYVEEVLGSNYTFSLPKSAFAARVYLTPNSVSASGTYANIKGYQLNYDAANKQYLLKNLDGAQICQSDQNLHLVQDWLLVGYDNALMLVGDGRSLMFCSNLVGMDTSGGTLELASTLGSWKNFSLGYDPVVSLAYADGLGRAVQSHHLGDGGDIGMDNLSAVDANQNLVDIASGLIYDHWGHGAVSGMSAVVGSTQTTDTSSRSEDRFSYFSHLMDFDWQANTLATTSDIYEFYQSGSNEDAAYAFAQNGYELSPLGRLIRSVSASGQQFSLSSTMENYATQLEYQVPGEQSIASDLNLEAYKGELHFDTSSQVFASSATMYNQSVTNDVGAGVYSRTVSNSQTAALNADVQFGFQTDWYDGDTSTSISNNSTLLPNYFYFDEDQENDLFVNQSRQLDSLGLWTSGETPDVSGMTHVFRDNKGRVRFAQRLDGEVDDASQLSVMAENFAYWKYDAYDRVIEIGTLASDSTSDYQTENPYTLANLVDFPPATEACVKTVYDYDAVSGINWNSSMSNAFQQQQYRNWRGRLVRVYTQTSANIKAPQGPIELNSQCIDQFANFAENWHYYDDFGSAIGTTETLYLQLDSSVQYPASSSRNTGYHYDNSGAITSVVYPDQDRAATMTQADTVNFDLSGQTEIFYVTDQLGRGAGVCDQVSNGADGEPICAGNQYVKGMNYTFDGLLSSRTLGDGGRESYQYNFPRMPTGILSEDNSGNKLFQESMYYGVDNDSAPPSACSGKVYDRGYMVAREVSTDVASLSAMNKTECYTYDVMGRLTQVSSVQEGTTDEVGYSYDANGNVLTKAQTSQGNTTYTYENGTNQLDSISGNSVPYKYNNKGSVTQMGVSTGNSTLKNEFTRDPQSQRVMNISNQNCTVDYEYDGMGRRIQKSTQDVSSNSCDSN